MEAIIKELLSREQALSDSFKQMGVNCKMYGVRELLSDLEQIKSMEPDKRAEVLKTFKNNIEKSTDTNFVTMFNRTTLLSSDPTFCQETDNPPTEYKKTDTLADGTRVELIYYDPEMRKLQYKYQFQKGGKILLYEYYESGARKSQRIMKGFLRDGLFQQWYPSGKRMWSATYKDNQKEGESCEWYPNGQLNLQVHYAKGVLHGPNKQWYPNGQLMSETVVDFGKFNGLYRSWHENGQPHILRNYVKDAIIGESFEWDEQGSVIQHSQQ